MELSELEKHAILRTIRRMSKVEIETALRRLVIVEIEAEKIFDFPKARMAEKIRLFIED